MKWLILAFMLWMAVSAPGKPKENGSAAKPQSDNSPQTPLAFVDNSSHTIQADRSSEKPPKIETPIEWANWALVIVGLFTFRAIWIQARETTKATQAMNASLPLQKAAADAASLNAQAVINAERAWVVVEFLPFFRQDDEKRYWVDDEGQRLTLEDIMDLKHLRYYLRIKNTGRTPAQILRYQMEYFCLGEGIRDLDPTFTPDYSEVSPANRFLPDNTPIEIAQTAVGFHMIDSRKAIEETRKTAVFRWRVTYRNMFSADECYTECCYVYSPSKTLLELEGHHTKYT